MSSVLVVNAGSTSLKLHLVDGSDRSESLDSLDAPETARAEAVAHRIVHGGPRFRDPVIVDAAVQERIHDLERLAPLHNAPALAALADAERALPDLPQVAVFDTAFHATIPPEASTYAIPRQWRESFGVRRYGFHGLSVAWSTERAARLLDSGAGLRLVVCHLGGGCSVTAVRDGRSADTTMGFTPLEGVPMATRSGSLDPGAITYLIRERGLDVETLERALNFDSGLEGLAGRSGGMLAIQQAAVEGDDRAALALDVFVHRVGGAVATMAVAAGGLDALVFTAGIGEGSAIVRERICARLGVLGVELDLDRNAAADPDCDIAADGSGARVLVVRAREELVAARLARGLLDGG